jgi:hypothetical protein
MNTSDDLVASVRLLPVFQDPARQTHLSLCFKGCGGPLCPCGVPLQDSSSSSDWLSLADDFLADINATIAQHALNIRIILDGAANPAATHSACLSQRWRPLPTLFTAGGGTFHRQAFRSNSHIFAVADAALWSDNATLGWDRLELLNSPMQQWSVAASEQWGKFGWRPGPLICWEPSDQRDILQVYETFVASGARHKDGVLIASNIDPAMFQVWHQPLQLKTVLVTRVVRCMLQTNPFPRSTARCPSTSTAPMAMLESLRQPRAVPSKLQAIFRSLMNLLNTNSDVGPVARWCAP